MAYRARVALVVLLIFAVSVGAYLIVDSNKVSCSEWQDKWRGFGGMAGRNYIPQEIGEQMAEKKRERPVGCPIPRP